MSPPQPPRDWRARSEAEVRFVSELVRLAPGEDERDPQEARHRAIRAELRRGLGKEPGEALAMYSFLGPLLPGGAAQQEEDAYFLVASLFALHPRHTRSGDDGRRQSNLGASFTWLKRQAGAADSAGDKAIERRFITVLNASTESLRDHLRQAISLLRSKDVAVDYLQLLRDVQQWGAADRHVQRAWAGTFWGHFEDDTTEVSGEGASIEDAATEDE